MLSCGTELRGGPEQQTTQIYSYEPDYSVKEKVAKKGSCRDTGLWVTLKWWGSTPITRSHLLNILMEGHPIPHTSLPSPQNILHLPSLFIYETIHKKHSTQHRAFSHTTHPYSAHSHSTCPQSIPQQCWGTVAVGGPLPTYDRWPLTQRQINMNGLGSEGTSISPPLTPVPFLSLSVLLK